jgi:hypothetical protein
MHLNTIEGKSIGFRSCAHDNNNRGEWRSENGMMGYLAYTE